MHSQTATGDNFADLSRVQNKQQGAQNWPLRHPIQQWLQVWHQTIVYGTPLVESVLWQTTWSTGEPCLSSRSSDGVSSSAAGDPRSRTPRKDPADPDLLRISCLENIWQHPQRCRLRWMITATGRPWWRGSRTLTVKYWSICLATARSTTFDMNVTCDTGLKFIISVVSV